MHCAVVADDANTQRRDLPAPLVERARDRIMTGSSAGPKPATPPSNERLEQLVEKTYRALLEIVKTTAVTKRVLTRPPFTFLHKLLVELLAQNGIFSEQQLTFSQLVTKEDKAAFLTRAIAFVSHVMAATQEKCISVLLLVSPIKVLAGVAVEDTHEFLQQLCVVCKSTNAQAKEHAAQDVLRKGDAQLYTAGVTFRKGLVLIQAVIRTFIKRRLSKRKPQSTGTNRRQSTEVPAPAVGARFVKELPNGQYVDGIITGVHNTGFQVRYEQTGQVDDNVDEIEMNIILEASQRLRKQRERMSSGSLRYEDQELSLTSLPDLSVPHPQTPSKQGLTKRHSSRELARTPQVRYNRQSLSNMPEVAELIGEALSELAVGDLSAPQPQAVTEPEVEERSISRPLTVEMTKTPEVQMDEEEKRTETILDVVNGGERAWQASLKQLLANAHAHSEGLTVTSKKQKKPRITKKHLETPAPKETKTSFLQLNNIAPSHSHLPVFPELRIPGRKDLPPVSKRKQPTAGFTPAPKPKPATKPRSNIEGSASSGAPQSLQPQSSPASKSVAVHNLPMRIPPMPVIGETPVDNAFGGTYHSTDPKTLEKLALFREIVHRIDGYMKRKHLRVIDLFRFCDADGNGSISPQEMIDTLSQMEIQLSPEQAHDFINYIDKDGNGSIDVDEFEELVRVARRNEAQRELLRKELLHPKKASADGKPINKYTVLIKNRQRIMDELRSHSMAESGTISGAQIKAVIARLQISGIDDSLVGDLIERSRAPPVPDGQASVAPVGNSEANLIDALVFVEHFAKAMQDLDWTKKANRFLDHSWMAQFDSQLERANRDFELL